MTSKALLGSIMTAVLAAGPVSADGLAGRAAPDFVLPSAGGPNVRLSEYRGEVVMLAFEASWCGDCSKALAGLADTYERYSDAGVALIVVSLDRDPRDAKELARTAETAYPILTDIDGRVGRLYGVGAVPALVLVDRDGVVRDVFDGKRGGAADAYVESLRALLRNL